MSMDPGFPLSQSPRTQGFQQPQGGPQDEEEIFSSSFRDLAYRAFQKTQPQLFPQVITFRVLAVDAPNGEGVGAFIVKAEGEILFTPVVIADNAVKPLDMFYARSKDRFYPLTSEWVDRLSMDSVSSLGDGVKPPKDLNTDVDIRNVIVPPTTGRYSYAELEAECDKPFRAARAYERELQTKTAAAPKLVFPELLSRMPDGTKLAAAEYLKTHISVFRKLAEVYGVKTLEIALRPSPVAKTADDHRLEVPMKHDVFMADASMPFQDVRKALEPHEVGPAYQALRLHGFYVKDRRKSVPNGVDVVSESVFALERPEANGMYRVFLADGTVHKVLVITNPIGLGGEPTDFEQAGRPMRPRTNYLVLFQDGRSANLRELLAEPCATESFEDIEAFLKKCTVERPGNDEHGVLAYAGGTVLRATDLFKATNVASHADLVTCDAEFCCKVILSKKMQGAHIVRPAGQETMVVPGTYRWFKAKTKSVPGFNGGKAHVYADTLAENAFLLRADLINRVLEAGVEKHARAKIYCVKQGSEFVVTPGGFPMKALEASVKMASLHGITVSDASRVVEATAHGLAFTAYATRKTAAEAPPAQPDPAAEAAAMANMPPPAPPPPSGMELALAEKMQLLQAQQASIAQMQQLVSELQQRAMGIDQGGGAMAAPMAAAGMSAGAPADPNMMAPVPGMPGDPAMQQGAPQGDPSMQQGQGAPQDPNAMPMDPNALAAQGQDPSMGMQPEAPPPTAMMPKSPNPAMFEQEINPDHLGDAQALNDQGVFDASAVASLANVRSVKDLLQNYIPVLDNALDRLGRSLLLLYVKSREIRERIGEEAYTQLEQKVRDTFRMLGDSLMAIEQYGDQMLPRGARTA